MNVSMYHYSDDAYTCSKNMQHTCLMPDFNEMFDPERSPAILFRKLLVTYRVNKFLSKKTYDLRTMPVALTTCGRILMYADQMKGYILNIKKLKKISMSKLELQGYWGIHIKFSFATITLCVEEPYVNLWSTKLSELFEGKRLRPYIHMKQNYDKEWVVKTGQRIDNLVDNKNKENVKVPETPKKEIKTPLKCNQMDTPRNGERTIIRNMNYKSPIETPVRRTQSDAITPWRSEVKGVKITDEMFIKANKNEGKSKGENVVSSPPSAKSPSLYTTTRENCCIMDKNNNNYQCDFDNVCDDFGSKRNFFKRLQQAA